MHRHGAGVRRGDGSRRLGGRAGRLLGLVVVGDQWSQPLGAGIDVDEQRLREERQRDGEQCTQGADHPGPEQQVELQSKIKDIQNFLQSLLEIDRTAFILRVQQDMPYAEIARTLGISLSTAKVKVHRVRKKLIAWNLTQEEVPG